MWSNPGPGNHESYRFISWRGTLLYNTLSTFPSAPTTIIAFNKVTVEFSQQCYRHRGRSTSPVFWVFAQNARDILLGSISLSNALRFRGPFKRQIIEWNLQWKFWSFCCSRCYRSVISRCIFEDTQNERYACNSARCIGGQEDVHAAIKTRQRDFFPENIL